jgi:hypothetical protein
VTMPSAQENTAKPIRPDTRIPRPAPWDLLLGGVRVAGPALAPAQLSLAERCFRHLSSCIVGCRMMHVLTRGAVPKVRILHVPDLRPSKNTRRRKFQSLFRIRPMNDPGTRQCGAKTRSGEPCRLSPAPGKASAVSMVVRLAAVRQLASVMGHGRAADTAKRSYPHRDTRPGRITGPRRGRRTPPWWHSRHQRGATDPMVATVNENTDRNYALHES